MDNFYHNISTNTIICYLFTFEKNNKKYYFTNNNRDISVDNITYQSQPSLEYSPKSKITATSKASEITIKADKNIDIIKLISRQEVTEKITITVEKIDTVSTFHNNVKQIIFHGLLSIIKNSVNRNKICELTCISLKYYINKSFNVRATTTCDWGFGSEPCGFDLESNKKTAKVINTRKNGNSRDLEVQMSGTIAMTSILYKKGTIRNKNLKIPINFVDFTNSVNPDPLVLFNLVKPAPSSWVNNSVDILFGCDKLISTCRIHGREESHLAMGVAIPSYNPLLKTS